MNLKAGDPDRFSQLHVHPAGCPTLWVSARIWGRWTGGQRIQIWLNSGP